jgi:hypothetical protein
MATAATQPIDHVHFGVRSLGTFSCDHNIEERLKARMGIGTMGIYIQRIDYSKLSRFQYQIKSGIR